MHWFIIQTLSAFAEVSLIKTSTISSFIVLRYSFIRLLSDVVSSEGLSIAWHQHFHRQMASFQASVNTYPPLPTCTALTLPADRSEGSFSSTLVILDNFLIFYFPCSQVKTITCRSFFPKLVINIPPFFMLQPISRAFSID